MVRHFLAELDTPGGHLLCCLLMIVIGGVFTLAGVMDLGHELIVGSTAVLFKSMLGQNGKAHSSQPARRKKKS